MYLHGRSSYFSCIIRYSYLPAVWLCTAIAELPAAWAKCILHIAFERSMKRTRAAGEAHEDAPAQGAKRAKVDTIITQLMPSLVTSATVWQDDAGANWSWMVSTRANCSTLAPIAASL